MSIVDHGPKIEGELERIGNSDGLTEGDRDHLLEYKRDMEVEGLSASRVYKVLYETRKLAERLDKDLADATLEDVKDLVAWAINIWCSTEDKSVGYGYEIRRGELNYLRDYIATIMAGREESENHGVSPELQIHPERGGTESP